jgi:hypothetical protein
LTKIRIKNLNEHIFNMRKPKSLMGPASKRGRQQYKRWKGTAFPRRKIKRFPKLMEMYRKMKSLEESGLNWQISKAKSEFFFSRLFSPRIQKHLAIVGCEIPRNLNTSQGRMYAARMVSNRKRVKNCSERELQKIEKSVQAISRELKIAGSYIQKECFTLNVLNKLADESAFVRHDFDVAVLPLLTHISDIAEIIAKRKHQNH